MIVFILVIVVTTVAHIWVPVPVVPTPNHIIETALTMAKLKGNETFLDLGAGDGRALIIAKKRYPKITAIGSELIPTVWLFGKLRIWLSKQDVTLLLCDARKQDVSKADCIFLYLIPGIMDDIQKKFDTELRPGTKVLSYAFAFPSKKAAEEKDVPWITGTRKLRMYVW